MGDPNHAFHTIHETLANFLEVIRLGVVDSKAFRFEYQHWNI